ncbi:hypothetical protein MLD38_015448 [Melastoma candidum]|uniref:Uncharacterized protein n=1 Tax=Melastoma candidum TaxID=119954 RepID=A0ACB9RPK8_9MYRT|nr:hypothetical protein MLD38_015448 [Melastoma candidum]
MCTANDDRMPNQLYHSYGKNWPRRSKVRVSRLIRRRDRVRTGRDIELKNLKLYLENRTIIEENDKLRKKADLLRWENSVLLSELKRRFPHMTTLTKDSA